MDTMLRYRPRKSLMQLALTAALLHSGLVLPAMFEQLTVNEMRRSDGAHPLRVPNIDIGPVAYGSLGTSAVHVAGSIYLSEIYLPRSMRVTSIGILNGAVVGTDNLIFGLFDFRGRRLGNSALAGTLSAGANAFQEIALVTPVELSNDGRYFLAVQCNGTTATTRRIAANTWLNRASVTAGTFGTIPGSMTMPTGFTADAGPIGYVL